LPVSNRTRISSVALCGLLFLGLSSAKTLGRSDYPLRVYLGSENVEIDLRGSFYLVADATEGRPIFLQKPLGSPTSEFRRRMSVYAKTRDLRPVEINFSYADDCRLIAKGREFCRHLSGISNEAFFLSGRLSLRPAPGLGQHSILRQWLSQIRPLPTASGSRSVAVLMGGARAGGLNCDSSGKYCALRALVSGSFVAEMKVTIRQDSPEISKEIEQQLVRLLEFYAW
jgi:hypothetical protein